MGEYKIGYVMKVTKEDDFYFGRIGKIEDRSSSPRQFCLRFAPGNMTAWFYAHELIHLQPDEIPFPERTPAPAQPATADAGAVSWDDPAIENTVEYWRKVAADNLALGSQGMDDRDAKIADLEAKLAAAEALAATNASLLANAQSELDTVRKERDMALDVLRDIARNAPQEQPHPNMVWQWTFWFAGSVAKSCVDALATSEAANG